MEQNIFYSPVKIGQKIYVPIDLDGEPYVDVLTVTEVGSKGCFVSCFCPTEEDLGDYFPYRDLGRTWFTERPKGGDRA